MWATPDYSEGMLGYTSMYADLKKYRESGIPEESGIIGQLGFKVLQEKDTVVKLENSSSMPTGKDGTILFNWYSEPIFDYVVIQPDPLKPGEEPTETPTEEPTEEPTETPTEEPTEEPTEPTKKNQQKL